jgi:hypothetical protein
VIGAETRSTIKTRDSHWTLARNLIYGQTQRKLSISLKSLYRKQNTEGHLNMKIDNKSFENVTEFKHLETRVTIQYYIHVEVKRKLNSENAEMPFSSKCDTLTSLMTEFID